MSKQRLKALLKLVETTFGRGDSHLWKNRDYEELSFAILQKTKILISAATLKRIFGKVKTDTNYTPQESTVKALCDFSGYTDIRNIDHQPQKARRRYYYIGILAIAITGAGLILNLFMHKTTTCGSTIKLIKTEGYCPLSAGFSIDNVEQKNEPKLYVDFGDRTKQTLVTQNGPLTHFYAYPGIFRAKLIDQKRIIHQTAPILVQTKGWQAFASYFEPEKSERYYPIPLDMVRHNSIISVTPRILASLGIDTTEIVVLRMDNFKPSNLTADNFDYEAVVKNCEFWPAIRCYSIIVSVAGTKGKVEFKLVGEGCSTFAWYVLGNELCSACDSTLNNLIYDRKNWLNIEIVNRDKKVVLYLNGNPVFEHEYTESLGNLVGTTIAFHGLGSIKGIQLYSQTHEFAKLAFE